MGHKRFYRFVFALFVSLNLLVYLIKIGFEPLYYISASCMVFASAYLFAMLVFRRFGWGKSVEQ